VLTPEQEVSPNYLRTVRQTLREIILPEVSSPAGRNAANLCDFILVRMIAALEELPAIRVVHERGYLQLWNEAAQLSGFMHPEPADATLWSLARDLQAYVPVLFAALDSPDSSTAREAARLLAALATSDAAFRKDYEAAYKCAEAKSEPLPQALLVTAEAVQLYLDARFRGDAVRVRSCHQIPGGRSKLTVLLSVEANAQLPEEMVLRIDAPGSAINTTVRDEFPVLDAMFRAGIAAPEPLWVEVDSRPLGAPFLAMRRMPGSAAGDLWGAEKVSPAIGLALAEALAGVHSANVHAIWPDAPPAARQAAENMIGTFEQSWRVGDSTPSLAMEGAFGWLKRHLFCIEGPTVAVHGDAHFANLLAVGDTLVCLLDWEFAHPGHPADDLAYCRGYVETIMSWTDFIAHYRDHGGPAVTEDQLRFFAVWGHLRNITYGANMLRDIAAGDIHGIQNLAIAINTRAKLEALLSRSVATALARDIDDTKL
jgi:aminoglycoside phosphotransferase (APT) family kinase protein